MCTILLSSYHFFLIIFKFFFLLSNFIVSSHIACMPFFTISHSIFFLFTTLVIHIFLFPFIVPSCFHIHSSSLIFPFPPPLFFVFLCSPIYFCPHPKCLQSPPYRIKHPHHPLCASFRHGWFVSENCFSSKFLWCLWMISDKLLCRCSLCSSYWHDNSKICELYCSFKSPLTRYFPRYRTPSQI